ncbi:MAG TPA: hypothetical protein VHL57_02855, partial [Flavobacteriales bacterium]|nr:hypothetical protein [Flavobacteriales bacterium]
ADKSTAKSLTNADLCKTYRETIRPKLEFLLPIIELIPVWGKQIAKGIRFLMGLADQVCPA